MSYRDPSFGDEYETGDPFGWEDDYIPSPTPPAGGRRLGFGGTKLLPLLVTFGAAAFLISALITIFGALGNGQRDPGPGFGLALAAYGLAALADTIDRRARDQRETSGRFIPAVGVWWLALLAAIAAAVLMANGAAL
ncbi:MAG: hypothetical protein F4Z36_07080 [Acidimicrobiia bacterium]|nr:hypothetical protein [Acidimicrobiia bacterium]